jgi:hypothetical protein
MEVRKADTSPIQMLVLHERHRFGVARHECMRQTPHLIEEEPAARQIAHGDFPDHERVRQHLSFIQQPDQRRIGTTKVIDPDRRIDQDHLGRRRRPATKSGAVPPNRARRLAASRSTNAFRPSRTKADFSVSPVNSWAA